MARGEDVSRYPFKGRAEELPKRFKDWLKANRERIDKAKQLPYFIRDNQRLINMKTAPTLNGSYEEYKFGDNGGKVRIHIDVSQKDGDFEKLRSIAEEFARTGRTAALTPKITRPPRFQYEEIYGTLRGTRYEGKCPDLNVDGLWYEHEGFITDNPKRAFKNMLNDGLKQSDRLVIDQPELTERYMRRVIEARVRDGQHIEEVLMLTEERKLVTIYKKTKG